MSDPVSPVAPAAKSSGSQSLQIGQSVIFGKVVSRRRMQTTEGTRVMTLVRCPAPDSYSHPSTLEISSLQPIGAPEDEVRVTVRIEGAPNSFNVLDKSTGESVRVNSARHFLRAVE